MTTMCRHLDTIRTKAASGPGCVECLQDGGVWIHLRRCTFCAHVGCCDDSPGTHATRHSRVTGHPLRQSYEPGEDWLWCEVDQLAFELAGDVDSVSHPPGWSPGPPARWAEPGDIRGSTI
jgi:hypothetical protein